MVEYTYILRYWPALQIRLVATELSGPQWPFLENTYLGTCSVVYWMDTLCKCQLLKQDQVVGLCCAHLITKFICNWSHTPCRRSALEQTLHHGHVKHEELKQFREGVKQPSPVSEASCHEAASHFSPRKRALSPHKHIVSPRAWQPPLPLEAPPPLPPPNAPQLPSEAALRTHEALNIASELDSVIIRLRQTVETMSAFAAAAPRMRHRITEYFGQVAAVKDTTAAEAAAAVGWGLVACSAEFGCDVRGNASAMSDACEKLAQLVRA
jgi:hypothetical protein